MKTHLNILFALSAGLSFTVGAESSLVYELVDSQGASTEQTYVLHGRWMRVNKSAEPPENFLILDTGFLIMSVVDGEQATYSTFGESHYHQGKDVPDKPVADTGKEPVVKAAAEMPSLQPTGKMDAVAGVRCRIVDEVVNDKPVAEHCMADSAALGISPRELITMSRLIDFSKQWSDPDWIAVQSKEKFISIRSRPLDGDATFTLKAVSHENPPADYFRVPPEYKKLDSDVDHRGVITGKKSAD